MDSVRALFERMKSAANRLHTFEVGNWPHSGLGLDPRRLAEAGFFFLMTRDRVQCAFCRGVVTRWSELDDPASEHQRHFARCPFVMGYNVENVPLDVDPYRNPRRRRETSQDVPKPSQVQAPSTPTLKILESYCIEKALAPKFDKFLVYEERLRSFESASKSLHQRAELAEAGFVYLGQSDWAQCFWCGGKLRSWLDDDCPWTEHACHFPHCQYVRLRMGIQFIQSVLKRLETNLKPEGSPKIRDHLSNLCSMCHKKPSSIVLLPCRHFVTCSLCTSEVTKCPDCLGQINAFIEPFV